MSDSLEDMLDDGSIVAVGISEDGDTLYMFTERCRELHPAAWQKKYNEFLNDISELWSLGYLDIDLAAKPDDDNIIINEKTFSDASELPRRLQYTLEAVREVAREESNFESGG